MMGVPNTIPVFQGRYNEGFVTFFLDTTGAASKIAFEEGKGGACLIAHCFAVRVPVEFAVYVDAKVFG